MKFPRTIRLDPSDVKVFPLAAEPGEWAVPGSRNPNQRLGGTRPNTRGSAAPTSTRYIPQYVNSLPFMSVSPLDRPAD